MSSLPFGLGGLESMSSSGGSNSTKTTKSPKQIRYNDLMRNMGDVGGAMQANRFTNKGGAALPGIMAFMGMPNYAPQRGWGAGGSNGGFGFGFPDIHGGGGKKPTDPTTPPDDGNGNGGNIGGQWDANGYLLSLLYPPPIGTGAQWRNTMKYGA